MKTTRGILFLLVIAAVTFRIDQGRRSAHAGVALGVQGGHVWHGDGARVGLHLGYRDGDRHYRHWPYRHFQSHWGRWAGYPWRHRHYDPWYWDDGWYGGRDRDWWRWDEERRRRKELELEGEPYAELRAPRPGRDFPDLDPRVARMLDENDPGESETWRGPDDGRALTVTPGAKREGGEYACRDYTIVSERDGQRQGGFATACKTKEGRWRLAE
jgi:hypothetical protein